MRLICPVCHIALPALGAGTPEAAVITCGGCAAQVDLSRAGTGVGRPRFVPEPDRTGDVIGGFQLAERLGAGGMGTVYRGVPVGSGGPAAIKFLSPALASDPELVARFAREVELLRALDHPGIVRVLAHGLADGVPWFAMELIPGSDLKTRLAAGPLSPSEVAAIFPRLLEALAYAHGRGVVHRDIKPANVLLGEGAPKLADFGIALPGADPNVAATRLTETAAIIGTLPYMSPEQRAGAEVDRRSDLFSVGVVLYEAATGRLPMGAFALPSRLRAEFPSAFDRLVARLLQPEPADRFASAADAARALTVALRPRRTTMRLLGAGAAAVLAAALGLGLPALSRLQGNRNAEQGKEPAAPPQLSATAPDAAPGIPPAPDFAQAGLPTLPLPLPPKVKGKGGKPRPEVPTNVGKMAPQNFKSKVAPSSSGKKEVFPDLK